MSLVRFLTAEKLTLAWYSMGPEDDNLYSFSVYLAAALDAIFPGLKSGIVLTLLVNNAGTGRFCSITLWQA